MSLESDAYDHYCGEDEPRDRVPRAIDVHVGLMWMWMPFGRLADPDRAAKHARLAAHEGIAILRQLGKWAPE